MPLPSSSAPTPANVTDLVIATRESRLALWQAEHVKSRLTQEQGAVVRLLGMTTLGDQILDRALSKVGGKGLFVKELETALADRRADLAVHSLKDVPMQLPEGFVLAAVLVREDPRDALVSPRHGSLAALPQGARVGTSSLRRVVQLKGLRPDLVIEPLRGNLDTRLKKLDEGQYDAIVLAAAGLKRLGLAARIACILDENTMLPAVGQGALAIEVRQDDVALQVKLQALNHQPTWLATHAERAVSRALGGSCSMPLAAHATLSDQSVMTLRAAMGHAGQPDAALLQAQGAAPVTTVAQAEAFGARVAAMLLAQPGAADYLAAAPRG